MARCRGCGQEIEWIKMKTGKSMPVDPERIMYWEGEDGDETLVTPDGEDGKDERQMDQGNPAEDAA